MSTTKRTPTRTQVQCDICLKILQGDLKRHMKMHATNREEIMYRCEQCPFQSLQRSNVGSHYVAVHTKIKPYHCPDTVVDEQGRTVKCNHSSRHPSTLTRHRKSRHGYDPNNCDGSQKTVGPAEIHEMYQHWVVPPPTTSAADYRSVPPTVANPDIVYRPRLEVTREERSVPNFQAYSQGREAIPPSRSLKGAEYAAFSSTPSTSRSHVDPATDMGPTPGSVKHPRLQLHSPPPPPI
ncbi:hypothetical protein BV20DRAFT_1125043 [Pilatotrama ljubarskyi]|nr:hypothetical protein BV20DRAFT_1125043 [Pilatotrama ljubarskyi]